MSAGRTLRTISLTLAQFSLRQLESSSWTEPRCRLTGVIKRRNLLDSDFSSTGLVNSTTHYSIRSFSDHILNLLIDREPLISRARQLLPTLPMLLATSIDTEGLLTAYLVPTENLTLLGPAGTAAALACGAAGAGAGAAAAGAGLAVAAALDDDAAGWA